ncbi:uncharacterized protein HMPREF1541_04751 [Cyphellophora europaea CBS 101466]|uniref:Uncharacterized protein n=1 Tax=Cyphellophora europaea (strain CBS 101466) TaxID=1220924 RepID=W2RXT1_CYPE1|nr:uncharacterized protein HMPREF1541_04751 [Cyphellophora europaea CBS 101466]ETN40474.1 hypothetical protein HMPREF1541_04751 [Cyphellophora europaea CBS 101466]
MATPYMKKSCARGGIRGSKQWTSEATAYMFLARKSPSPIQATTPTHGNSILLPWCMASREICELLEKGPLDAPITTESLKELDLLLIKNNLNLRIDVHFDHDLHFMPISGRRGEEKRSEARRYWRCLELELQVYQHDALGNCESCSNSEDCGSQTSVPRRLHTMFAQMKELILLLVPDDDHEWVRNTLDVGLLVQEVQNGVLDVENLSLWLKALLTNHCAPIRDDWAEEMASTITSAAKKGNMQYLVVGLEKLFSFLECMRLDVANHQIRTYRIPLIEDGVAFQIDYFEARIAQGKLSVEGSRHWFAGLCEQYPRTVGRKVKGLHVLVHGLTELCTKRDTPLPITLKHDLSRLRQIQQELQDIIHFRICELLFDKIVRNLRQGNERPPNSARLCPMRLMDLIEDERGGAEEASASHPWRDNADSIAVEITQQAFRGVVAAHKDSSTATVISPEVFRHVQRVLHDNFEAEDAKHAQADSLTPQLERRVLEHASRFDTMTPLEISEEQKRTYYHQARAAGGAAEHHHGRSLPQVDDIARRLAHISVIHWRVWRGLAYLDREFWIAQGVEFEKGFEEEEEDGDGEGEGEEDTTDMGEF